MRIGLVVETIRHLVVAVVRASGPELPNSDSYSDTLGVISNLHIRYIDIAQDSPLLRVSKLFQTVIYAKFYFGYI